jgi:hypothetical protein
VFSELSVSEEETINSAAHEVPNVTDQPASANAEALAPGAPEQYYSYRQANQMGPLVEADPTADDKNLITFLFRGDETTRSVVLGGGPNPVIDSISLLPFCASPIWYITLSSLTVGKFGYYFCRASTKRLIPSRSST